MWAWHIVKPCADFAMDKDSEKDVFREVPLRYLGKGMECVTKRGIPISQKLQQSHKLVCCVCVLWVWLLFCVCEARVCNSAELEEVILLLHWLQWTPDPTHSSTVNENILFYSSGYANEVGEAFRHMVPVKLVYLSYLVSSAYVISHSFTRGTVARDRQQKTLSKGDTSTQINSKASLSPTTAFLDTLIWQGLASVLVPGLVINRTCALSRLLLYQVCRKNLSKTVRKWTVTGIGLGSIPFIIHPIDRCVCKTRDDGCLYSGTCL